MGVEALVVRFSFVDEFVAEMRQDAHNGMIERDIVRLTRAFRPKKHGISRDVLVVASYVAAGRLTTLEHFVGEEGWSAETDLATEDRGKVVMREIEGVAESEGVDLRAGALEIRRGDEVRP